MIRIIASGFAVIAGCVLGGNADAQQVNAITAGPVHSQPPPVTPQLFGTEAVIISGNRFADQWERARRDASAMPQMRNLIAPATSMKRSQQIGYVQSAVHRRIRWRSDATQWQRHDYWASAAETLERGFGDMEDRAIVKMEALRALGVPTSDLYLTLGRDRVSGPEAVLIVRDRSRYYILDDRGSQPYTPERRPEFRPVLTFGFGASWVHVPRADSRVAANTTSHAVSASAGMSH